MRELLSIVYTENPIQYWHQKGIDTGRADLASDHIVQSFEKIEAKFAHSDLESLIASIVKEFQK